MYEIMTTISSHFQKPKFFQEISHFYLRNLAKGLSKARREFIVRRE